jgi:ribokinase
MLRRNGRRIANAEAPKVRAIDTVGAGDSFTAALTLALIEGQDPSAALRFACAAGAAATMKAGAQPSLPDRAAVEHLL